MSDYKPTVMPKDESLHKQTQHGGAPGLYIPGNGENIDAFREVSDVNAQDLNAQIKAQEQAKHTHQGHGLQQFDHEVPVETNRDAKEVNATLQAQDRARQGGGLESASSIDPANQN